MKTNYQIFVERDGIEQPIAHVACSESDLFRVLLRYAQLTGIDTDFFSARAIVGGGAA